MAEHYLTPSQLGQRSGGSGDYLDEPYGIVPEAASLAEVQAYHLNFAIARIAVAATDPLPPGEALLHLETFRYFCSHFDSRPFEDVMEDMSFIYREYLDNDVPTPAVFTP